MLKNLYLGGEDDMQKIHSWKEKLASTQKKWKSLNLKRSALMVIDMQQYFLDEQSHAFVPTGAAIVPNVQHLLRLFRERNLPIIFTYFAVKQGEQDPIGNWWGRTVREESKESAIIEELAPRANEKVLRKASYNSFHNTDLELFLRDQNVRSLVIAGVLTNLCCETTAREAFSRAFDVFFVMDATASFNEEMHLASLINLSCGFATPLSTEEISQQYAAV